jgi:Predicted membrane protein (DUF2306)
MKSMWLKYYKYCLLIALSFFSILLLRITIAYIPYNTDVAFLRIKQQYLPITVWRYAFFIHVYTSMFVLLAGFTQFWRSLQTKFKKVHKTMGYMYLIGILFITGPASIVMGFYANGGISSRIAFVTLGCLWLFFTARAWYFILQKNYTQHKYYMWRSYALTLSAVTLRLIKFCINNTVHLPPMDVYRFVAWAGWVINLLVIEYFIYKKYKFL